MGGTCSMDERKRNLNGRIVEKNMAVR